MGVPTGLAAAYVKPMLSSRGIASACFGESLPRLVFCVSFEGAGACMQEQEAARLTVGRVCPQFGPQAGRD